MTEERSQSIEDLPYDGVTVTIKDGEVLEIRRLGPSHSESLREFHKALGADSKRLFTPHAYDAVTVDTYIKRSTDGVDLIYVAVNSAERIVAYFFLWELDDEVPALGIGIADEYQNRGLGRRLMQILIDSAKLLGKSGLELTTMPDNDRAFRLYKSCGFRYLGDVSNLTGDGRTVTERRLFLEIVDGTEPPDRAFAPPV